MAVVVHAVSIQDYDGAKPVFATMASETFKRLKVIFADSAYGKMGLPDWTRRYFGWVLQTVLRLVNIKGFVVLPKR